MLSPEQVEKQQPQARQAPSPAAGKQVPIAEENTRPWLKPLKPTLGTVLPLIGGIALIWGFLSFDLGSLLLVGLEFLAVTILGGVGVVLLFPFRWAVGIVSLAFAFGELLAFFIAVGFNNTWSGYTATATFGVFLPLGVILGFFAALVGAAIGFGINKARQARQ